MHLDRIKIVICSWCRVFCKTGLLFWQVARNPAEQKLVSAIFRAGKRFWKSLWGILRVYVGRQKACAGVRLCWWTKLNGQKKIILIRLFLFCKTADQKFIEWKVLTVRWKQYFHRRRSRKSRKDNIIVQLSVLIILVSKIYTKLCAAQGDQSKETSAKEMAR